MAFCVSHRVHIQQAKRSAFKTSYARQLTCLSSGSDLLGKTPNWSDPSKTSWTEQVSYGFVSPLLLGKTTQLKEGKSNSTEP